MSNILVSDIKSGDKIDQVFLVQKCDTRMTKTGSPYIMAQLADKTGQIEGRLWNAREPQIEIFTNNDIINVKGKVETYQNNFQLIIESLSTVDESTLDITCLLPCTEKDIEVLMQELKEFLLSVENKHILELFKLFLDDEDICKGLRTAPAAVQFHHAFIGGLLEHIVSVFKLASAVLPNYPIINRDLLYAGIFFHDIGKITELLYSRSFKYSDEGMLVGHIITGVNMINEKARLIKDFPKDLQNVLIHMVLSHHGTYEWGSPKLPMTVESIALHYLDNFDAKIYAFNKAINNDKNINSNWTDYNRMFERKLFKNL